MTSYNGKIERYHRAAVTYLEGRPAKRARAACARARYFASYTYGALKNILRKGLDLQPLPDVVLPERGRLEHPRLHVVAGEDVADVGADLLADRVCAFLPVLLAAMTQFAATFREVSRVRSSFARGRTFVGGNPRVVEEQRDRIAAGTDGDLLADEAPRHRVHRLPKEDVGIGVDLRRVPDRELVGRPRERQ